MIRSDMVILSDIAAGTLAIALMIFAVVVSLGPASPASNVRPEMNGEVDEVFQTVSGRPLTSTELVTRIYARTKSHEGQGTFVDFFEDRLEISRKTGASFTSVTLNPTQPDFAPRLSAFLAKDGASPLTYFVFSNELVSATHSGLGVAYSHPAVVHVPTALKMTMRDGQTQWHTELVLLMQANPTRETFVQKLTQLLQGSTTSVSEGNGIHHPLPTRSLLERLRAGWRVLGTVLLFSLAAGVILGIERTTKNEKTLKSAE